MRLRSVVALLFVCILSAFGQQEKTNIYLLDCTNSMIKQGLWEPAKATLAGTFAKQTANKSAEFVVIPFGDHTYESYTFKGAGYNDKLRSDMEQAFEKHIIEAKSTNISAALRAAFAQCRPGRQNNIYLLTDGLPNGVDNADKVARLIEEWCVVHGGNRLFYVGLTQGVVADIVKDAIDKCPGAYVAEVQGDAITDITDLGTLTIYANTMELDALHKISYSDPGVCPLRVVNDDPIFSVEVVGGASKDGIITVKLSPRTALTPEALNEQLESEIDAERNYEFDFDILSRDPGNIIVNPTVHVVMTDVLQTKLTLMGGENEIAVGEASWYDSFLWADAAPDAEYTFTLDPAWENVQHPQTAIAIGIEAADDAERNFSAYVDGRELAEGETFVLTPNDNPEIRIVMNHDAPSGTHYFKLVNNGSAGVDLINGQPAGRVKELTARADYEQVWNPLKTFLMWLGIVLGALLILWFAVFKRMFYPTVKAAKIEMAGPGSYYISKKVKGVRKVVFTARRRSQNIFSRIFTGKVLYVKADHFTPEIEAVAGARKKVRFRSSAGADGWIFTPAATLSPYDKATMNGPGGMKAEVSVQ